MRSTWLYAAFFSCVPGAAVALAVGCSSSSKPQQLQSDGGGSDGTTMEATPGDDAGDAGSNIDQDPDVYPADHQAIPQIDYNGGPILQNVRIVTVTFTGNAHRDALRSFDHFITGSSWWQQTVDGYCVPGADACVSAGTSQAPDGGAWLPDGSTADAGDGYLDVELGYDFAGNTIDDSDIQKWLAGHVAAGDFPAPDSQTLYVVYFPQTTSITLQGSVSCQAFGAYHNSAPASGPITQIPYATIPFCDYGQGDLANFKELTISASHEIAEAVTDPQPEVNTAFYLHSNDAWLGALSYGGGEVGDMCTNAVPIDYQESGWDVQRIWSNQAAAHSKQPCQPWDDSAQPYFAAALRTPPLSINGRTSAGYVVVKPGGTTVAIADVFSEAPLAHDLTLYAGKSKGPGHLPSDIDLPDDGITIDLSKTQVHNGNGVDVTFTASSKALKCNPANVCPTWQPGCCPQVVLRAVFDNNDYNDWPVLVDVQ